MNLVNNDSPSAQILLRRIYAYASQKNPGLKDILGEIEVYFSANKMVAPTADYLERFAAGITPEQQWRNQFVLEAAEHFYNATQRLQKESKDGIIYRDLFTTSPGNIQGISDEQRRELTALIGLAMGRYPTVTDACKDVGIGPVSIGMAVTGLIGDWNRFAGQYFHMRKRAAKRIELEITNFDQLDAAGYPIMETCPTNSFSAQVEILQKFLKSFGHSLFIKIKIDQN